MATVHTLPHTDSLLVKMHALTSAQPTAEHLRIRAAFWRRWADTAPQSAATYQVYVNVDAMLREAARLDAPAPVVQLLPSPAKRKPLKAAAIGAEQFWTLHSQAVRAIVAAHGLSWRNDRPAETIEVTLPARLCSYVGPLGGRSKWRRDHRMPAPQYWPGGQLPEGVEALPTAPRYTGLMDRSACWRNDVIAYQIVADRQHRERELACSPSYPRMEA